VRLSAEIWTALSHLAGFPAEVEAPKECKQNSNEHDIGTHPWATAAMACGSQPPPYTVVISAGTKQSERGGGRVSTDTYLPTRRL
jgi:hypothetical protein